MSSDADWKLPWAAAAARYSYETVPQMAEFETLMKAYAEEGGRP